MGKEADHRSDIYSLGVLLFEMLTGRLPFTGASEYELMKAHVEEEAPRLNQGVSSVPRHIERAVIWALEKSPENRLWTTKEFRTLLLGNEEARASLEARISPCPSRQFWDSKGEVKTFDVLSQLNKRIVELKAGGGTASVPDQRQPRIAPPSIFHEERVLAPSNDSLERIAAEAQSIVPGVALMRGWGDPTAELLAVDQSPESYLLEHGTPFAGQRNMREKMLGAIGLSKDDCCWTHVVKCDEGHDFFADDSSKFMIEVGFNPSGEVSEHPYERGCPYEDAFRPYLLREILVVAPRVILALGGVAARTLLRSDKPLSDLRGTAHHLRLNGRDFTIVPSLRPWALLWLRSKEDHKTVRDDLALARRCLEAMRDPPRSEAQPEPTKSALVLAELGRRYGDLGNLDLAIQIYEQTLKKLNDGSDSFYDVLLILGWAYFRAERYADAVNALLRIIELRPNEAGPFHSLLGRAYEAMSRRDDAANAFSEALRLDPGNAEAASCLARLMKR